MKFESLNLHPDLLKGIQEAKFERCLPVQEQALPESLKGKDVSVQAQTGTGKTAVFLITMFQRFLETGGPGGGPRGLVLVPTRELAVQVENDAQILGKYLSFEVLSIYGGVGYEKQESALKEGVDIIVATPGRFIDLYKSKKIDLGSIQIFVVDEADRMFDMGFYPDIQYVLGKIPGKSHRQTMIFSATLEDRVRRLSESHMNNPELVEIDPDQVTVESIEQLIFHVSNEEKLPLLLGLLGREEMERVIVFTNMKVTAEELAFKLNNNDIPCEVITGDLDQKKRLKVIERMKAGKTKVLVATDVAARGLHIENVSHVINYDLPEDAANYVHRIGRTARLGRPGKAFSLACERWVLNLMEIERYIEHKIEPGLVEDEMLVPDKAGRYHSRMRRRGPDQRHDQQDRDRPREHARRERAPARERTPERARAPERDRTPERARPQPPARERIPEREPVERAAAPEQKRPQPRKQREYDDSEFEHRRIDEAGFSTRRVEPKAAAPSRRGDEKRRDDRRDDRRRDTPSNGQRSRRGGRPIPQPVVEKGAEIPHLHQRRERKAPVQFSSDVTPSSMPRPEMDRLEYYKWKYGENFSVKKEKAEKHEKHERQERHEKHEKREPRKHRAAHPQDHKKKGSTPVEAEPPKAKKVTLLSKILKVFSGR